MRYGLILWAAAACSPAQTPSLPPAIEEQLKAAPGEVWFDAQNLRTGRRLGHRGEERVRTASTIKLPIMAALFAEVARGRLRWDQQLELRKGDIVSGSGVLTELSPGTKLSLRDLRNLMIVVSDNTATNLILDVLPAERVNVFLDGLELRETRSLRKVRGDGTQLKDASGWSKAGLLEGNKMFGLGVTTPAEMVRLLKLLEEGKVVDEAASKEMLAVLLRQQHKDGIGRRMGGLRVASKSGSLDRLRSDVGIVYAPGGPVAMAITVDGMAKTDYSAENPALAWIGHLAEKLVAELGQ
jgi:beta-lactamase class A